MKSKRILFFKLGALGDVLMSTPLVRQVRKNYPNAKIDYLVGKSSMQSLIGNENIDDIISFDQDIFLKRDMKGLSDLIKNIKSKKYDIIFVLDKHWIFNLTSFFFGIKERIGFQRGNEGVLLTKRVKYKKIRHEILYYLDLGLNIDYKDVKIDIFPSNEEVKNAERLVEDFELENFYVLVNSGGNNPAVNENIRKMPDDLFMNLVKELSKKKKVVFLASLNEKDYYDKFVVNEKCVNLSGKTNIRETYCIMKKAKMVVTTDSGPMHIASAATDKIISIFGPTNPARKAPLNKGARSVWKDEKVYDERYELYGQLPKGKFFNNLRKRGDNMSDKKMKVLLITDNYDPRGGGAEKVFFKSIEELKKDCFVYSLGFGKKSGIGKDYKVIKETKSLFMRHLWRLFFNPIKYIQIREYIKKVNPDVVHLHNINKYTISLLLALRGYKVVQTVHDYGLVCPTLWNVHNDLTPCSTGMNLKCIGNHKRDYNIIVYLSMVWFFYVRNFLLKRIVQCFISPSPQLKYYLDKNGFKNVKFIPNPIDIKKNIKPNFDKIDYNQILYLGQLEKNKGVHILIDEMKYVVKEYPKVILKIAGSGSEKESLIQLTKKLNLEKNVEFLGWVDDVGKLIQESAFLVVPSIWMEQFGLVNIESMIYYRPIIGSNRGGIPWLIQDKKAGFLFEPLTKKDLSSKIMILLNNPSEIKKMGKYSHKRVKKIIRNDEIYKKNIFLYKNGVAC